LGNDPTTNIIGIKWDLPLKVDESRTYSITFEGDVALGNVLVAVKGGPGFETATLPGPSCDVYSIDVEKLLSIDGGLTWDDVDTAPGLDVELGTEVRFRVIVTNNGNSDLTGITLSDNVFDLSGCAVQDTLNPDAFFECEFGPFPAEEGQHTNIVTTTGAFPSGNGFTTDTDAANYFGGDRPSIIIAKAISSNYSASWNDADTAPGPSLDIGADVFFRLTVTNNGNVALTELSLSDTTFDTSSCQIPSSLEPEGSFECVLGPFQVVEGPHTNTATTSAMFDGTAVTASDDANYIGEVPVVETPVINDGDNDAGRDDDVVSDEDSQPSGDGTVTLCHIPPGNPNAAHTITVGEPAVQEHLGHGDTLGPCSGSSGGGGPPDDRGRGEGRGD
jgi:hypothetical protein